LKILQQSFKMPFSLRLALRYLFSPDKGGFSSFASWLAIGGLAIGITALMLTASIIHGFQEVISEKLLSFDGTGRIQHILGKQIDLSNVKLDSLIQSNPNSFSPFIRGVCMVRAGGNADGVLIEGLTKLPKAISAEWQGTINSGEIILGNGLATELKIELGDKVYLQVFSTTQSSSFTKKIKSMVVKHIFHSGLQEYDKTLAFVHMDDAKSLFGFKDKMVSGLTLIQGDISSIHDEISYPYYFETWQERHALLFEWIKLQRWPAYIMFGLIALVGLVNIFAAIAMIILEKSKQIGILMAQGADKSQIKQIFMIQGGFIGLVGSFIGGLISILIIMLQLKFEILKIPAEIYFMDQIPFSFDFPVFGIILLSTLVLCLIASWWPTKSITTMIPATALRYE
jgi:lipoprotein-releasing system permease protein